MAQQRRTRVSMIRQRGFLAAWPAYLLTVLVAVAAVYSFAPRTYPPAPVTQVHPDRLLVTQLAQRGSRWLSAGEQGRILIADSEHGPWREAAVAPQRGSNFNDVLFVSDTVALAVGHESWIVRSEDGGQTWSETLFDAERSEPLLALAGPYNGTVFAIGGFGQYLTSTDEGKTWQRATHEAMSDFHLNDMTQLSDGTLVIAGERGLLATSCDNGQTWTKLPEIYAGSYFGALALKDNGLLVYGMRGNAFVTQDRHTWVKAEVPGTISLFGGVVDDDGHLVLVGENETVLRSTDGGQHFTVAVGGERNRLTTVLAIEGEGWLVAGESGIGLRKPGEKG
jgi:photosystem II stability/assembly factor-like uncharacterized protein